MNLFNTQSQQLESFSPRGDEVRLHVLAATPSPKRAFDIVFLYCFADVLKRYLEMKGWQVWNGLQLVVDDEDNSPGSAELGEYAFIELLQMLNVHPPDQIFRTYEVMPELCAADLHITCHKCGQVQVKRDQKELAFVLQTAVSSDPDREEEDLDEPVLMSELLQRWSAESVRICLAQHHYRRPWAFNEVALEKASQCLEKLKAAMTAVSSGNRTINVVPARNRFQAALENDLDTGKGIATLLNLADEIVFRASNGYDVEGAQAVLQQFSMVFGLQLDDELGKDDTIVSGWNAYQPEVG